MFIKELAIPSLCIVALDQLSMVRTHGAPAISNAVLQMTDVKQSDD
jgi:hypothetical protein